MQCRSYTGAQNKATAQPRVGFENSHRSRGTRMPEYKPARWSMPEIIAAEGGSYGKLLWPSREAWPKTKLFPAKLLRLARKVWESKISIVGAICLYCPRALLKSFRVKTFPRKKTPTKRISRGSFAFGELALVYSVLFSFCSNSFARRSRCIGFSCLSSRFLKS